MQKIMLMIILVQVLGCASQENKNTEKGAVVGAVAGAALGAMLGGKHNQKEGALIGAALGGAAGATYGKKLDAQAQELKKIAETKRTKHGIVTKLKGDITFATGKTELTADARQRIIKMAKIIRKYPEDRLIVTGHTDSTGSPEINQKLSTQRAQAVKDLLAKNRVPAKHIKVIGAAAKYPVADNKTSAGRSQNRRVEITITMVDEKAAKKKK